MAELATKRTTILLLLLFLIPAFFLSSCLDLETGIRLKKDGSADASLTYIFNSDTVDFGRDFGSDEPWAFPLTEKDFIQQSLRVPGVELKRYRVHTTSGGSEEINVRLKADSIESLSSYLGLSIAVQYSDGGGSMLFSIPSADNYNQADSQFRENIEKIIGDSTFSISFRPPVPPEESQPGSLNGKAAVLELSLIDILRNETPDSWMVSW